MTKTFDALFKTVKLSDTMQKFLPILIFSIEKFSLNKCTGEVLFEAKAREPFDLVKDKVRVSVADYSLGLG